MERAKRDEKKRPPNERFKKVIWMPRVAPEAGLTDLAAIVRVGFELLELPICERLAAERKNGEG